MTELLVATRNLNKIYELNQILSPNSFELFSLSDLNIDKNTAPIPMILAVSALNQALIDNGLRMNVSIILETSSLSASIISASSICLAKSFNLEVIFVFA